MYNSNDPENVKLAEQQAAEKFYENLNSLNETKRKFSFSFTDKTLQESLDKAQKLYLQFPSPKPKEAIQQIAPIIPFEISFTLEGIQGFRYGDVVTFDVLPYKYKVNTVFSVISINHQISQDSTWTTEIRCIMRPRIE